MNGAPKQVLRNRDEVGQDLARLVVKGRREKCEDARESRGGLGDAVLGTRRLGRVAREEPVLRLVGVEERHRRQHPEGVTAEIDDVLPVDEERGEEARGQGKRSVEEERRTTATHGCAEDMQGIMAFSMYCVRVAACQ